MPLDLSNPKFNAYQVGDSGLTALVVGPSGIGKTTLMRGLIEAYGREEVVFCDFENRLLPLADLKPYRWTNGPLARTQDAIDFIDYLKAQVMARGPVPRISVFESLSEWSYKRYLEVRDLFPSRDKSGSFDRYDTLGLDGLDIIVRQRAIPDVIKFITCTNRKASPMDGGGYEYCLYGRVLPNNLAPKVDLILHIDEFMFPEGTFLPTHPLKQFEGRPVRAIQTGIWNGIYAKDGSGKLSLFEPTETEPGKRDGLAKILAKINPALAPRKSSNAPEGRKEGSK